MDEVHVHSLTVNEYLINICHIIVSLSSCSLLAGEGMHVIYYCTLLMLAFIMLEMERYTQQKSNNTN